MADSKFEFDVFLSHNSKNKPTVRELAKRLGKRNLNVWLDEEQLIPGRNWQTLMQQGIERSGSGAVLVGSDGLGPWHDEEMQVLLQRAVVSGRPVIPVLLPDAPEAPELPLFLANRTWVDFRSELNTESLDQLVWGITGEMPGKGKSIRDAPIILEIEQVVAIEKAINTFIGSWGTNARKKTELLIRTHLNQSNLNLVINSIGTKKDFNQIKVACVSIVKLLASEVAELTDHHFKWLVDEIGAIFGKDNLPAERIEEFRRIIAPEIDTSTLISEIMSIDSNTLGALAGGAAAGGLSGSFIPGVGTLAGAIFGSASGMIAKESRDKARILNKAQTLMRDLINKTHLNLKEKGLEAMRFVTCRSKVK